MVDEYAGETLEGKTKRGSMKPLTLGELHGLLTRAWGFHEVLEANFEGDVEGMPGFVKAESDFYPDLAALCRHEILEDFCQDDEDQGEPEADKDEGSLEDDEASARSSWKGLLPSMPRPSRPRSSCWQSRLRPLPKSSKCSKEAWGRPCLSDT